LALSHFNKAGRAKMVDVSEKADSRREAIAVGRVRLSADTLSLVKQGFVGKGDVLGVAQVAGVMGAKSTWQLIPMCHPLLLTGIDIDFGLNEAECTIEISASVKTSGKTGVEMEALTAVAVAALTIYDMCKAVDKAMVIEEIRLVAKSGGKSGNYRWDGENNGNG